MGEVTFLNYDVSTVQRKPDRNFINAHSQRARHRSRRHDDIREYNRLKAKAIEDVDKNHLKIRTSPVALVDLTLGHDPPEDRQIQDRDDENANPKFHYCAQFGLLQKGNSDPFNTFAIPVDAFVNEIMKFNLEYVIPSRFSLEVGSAPRTSPAAVREWNSAIVALQDACTGFALLALLATTLADTTPDQEMSARALRYKNRGLAVLRHRLADGYYAVGEQLFRSILLLLNAEIAAVNTVGATFHAKMLARLIQSNGGFSKVHPDIRRGLLWMDGHRATMSLTRPCMNVDDWIPEPFPQTTEPGLNLRMTIEKQARSIKFDKSVDDLLVRPMFIELREALEMLNWAASNSFSVVVGDPYLWPMVHCSVSVHRLLNRYADVSLEVDGMLSGRLSARCDAEVSHVQAYTCLSAIYWTRKAFGCEAITIRSWLSKRKAVIQESGPKILPRLREALMSTLPATDQYKGSRFAKLRLWALYVGAVAEQQSCDDRKLFVGAEQMWFTKNFAAQAKVLSLTSWSDVRHDLGSIIYSDRMSPDGSLWFSKRSRSGVA